MIRVWDAVARLHDVEDGEAIIVPFSLSVHADPEGMFVKVYAMVELSPAARTRAGVAVTVSTAGEGQLEPTVTGVQEAEALPLQFDTERLGEYWPAVAYVATKELLVEFCEVGSPNGLLQERVGLPLNPLMVAVQVTVPPTLTVDGDGTQLASGTEAGHPESEGAPAEHEPSQFTLP
jgi:hypothetical protein